MKIYTHINLSIGTCTALLEHEKICGFYLNNQKRQQTLDSSWRYDSHELFSKLALQIEEYLKQQRQFFDIPLSMNRGTPFQQKVWQSLQAIRYGEFKSYKQIAHEIGNPKSYRAVGHAIARNPFLILIPCHRVLDSKKNLRGFAAGLELKSKLLSIENIT